MDAARWSRIAELLDSALQLKPRERPDFLRQACAEDGELRAQAESMLAYEDRARTFLSAPAMEFAAGMIGSEPLPAGLQVGPYRILGALGAGGMGEVYRAADTRLDREVALKFLPSESSQDSDALQRFQREARAVSALNHPHICTLHDVGEHDGRPYLVLELLAGESLKERLIAGPLPVGDLLELALQMTEALATAHARNIVHRDIKPANLFIARSGNGRSGTVKILDFGVAKLLAQPPLSGGVSTDSRGAAGCGEQTEQSDSFAGRNGARPPTLTASGAIVGTLAYMSPEQLAGNDVDARSDIFSLGVVLYEMATGRRPFHGETVAGIMGSILAESPPKPSTVNPGTPAGLDRAILKALEKDPVDRYQSVARLSADLDALLRRERDVATRKTRRTMLTLVGAGAAGVAGGALLIGRSFFQPERRILLGVLPFENVGENPQDAFLADGLHQDMISVLNRLYPRRLGVIARTSAKRYPRSAAGIEQIGRDLKVAYVVEGSVQRERDRARVSVRLIRVTDKALLWSAEYDRDLGQIAAAQAEIAQAIAREIARGLQPQSQVSAALARPLTPAAHEAYLRGEYAKAIELDPRYAAAFTGLANKLYYPALFGVFPPREAFEKMARAASRALELDPTQAGAHACVALGKLHLDWNWRDAEEGCRRAIREDPADGEARHFLAHILLSTNRREESATECRRALELDPFNPALISCLGFHYLLSGDEEKALDATREALAFDPKHGWALMTLGWIYEQKGMFQEAISALRKSWDMTIQRASIAHAFGLSGNRPAAEKILGDLLAESKRKHISPYDIAVVYTGLGDHEEALASLNRAYEEHSGFLIFMTSDPRFKPLRSDRRFRELRQRMRFPDSQA